MRTAIAVIAALTIGVFPAPASATMPGQDGKIAYTERVLNSTAIRTVNPDGTGDTQVAANGYDPAWSPDGTKLAYAIDSGNGGGTIVVSDPDGTNAQTVASGWTYSSPTWSPDGTKIMFSGDSTSDTCQHLYEVDFPGDTAPVSVATIDCRSGPPHDPAEVDWSPRGDKVAYGVRNWSIFVRNADGSGAAVDPVGPTLNAPPDHPSWSPSGDWIAYSFDDTKDVPRTTPDGATKTPAFPGRQPDYSPDGTKLVAMNPVGGLDVVNDAGGERVTITIPPCSTGNCDHRQPDWQPLPPAPPAPGYARARGASPMTVSLVPAYEPCDSPNATHGAPLAFGSCSPPAQSSSLLTMGTPDANGAQAASLGRAMIIALPGDPFTTTADEADVRFQTTITDVRCRGAAVPGCEGGPLSDYTGSLREMFSLAIEDKYNGGSATDTARGPTFSPYQMPFMLTIPCTATATDPGATCTIDTTADSLIPGVVIERKRAQWELGRIEVWDAGEDGNPASDDNALFAVQGLFVP
jgi:hypothetical protein